MGRPELGTKCACASCAERFYDLNRVPAVCPKCGATQPPAVARVARPIRAKFGGSPYLSRGPAPAALVEEDAAPPAEDEDDEDGEDAADVPELDPDADADVEPIARAH